MPTGRGKLAKHRGAVNEMTPRRAFVRGAERGLWYLPAVKLPSCYHRGEAVGEGRFACEHPQLAVPGGVDRKTCRECAAAGIFCNRAPRDMKAVTARNRRPHLLSRVWNLSRSLRSFVSDGMTTVDPAQYERRLAICNGCEQRWNDDCKICGCRLSLKARGRAFSCPLGLWLAVASEDDPEHKASA